MRQPYEIMEMITGKLTGRYLSISSAIEALEPLRDKEEEVEKLNLELSELWEKAEESVFGGITERESIKYNTWRMRRAGVI